MSWILDNPVAMFIALFALYSPLASVSSYFPIVSKLDKRDQRRLAFGLFSYVTTFAMRSGSVSRCFSCSASRPLP